MENQEQQNSSAFQEFVRKFETEDCGSAEVFNTPLETLIRNDRYLKGEITTSFAELSHLSGLLEELKQYVEEQIAKKLPLANLANTCTTEEAGFALDARQGTNLAGKIENIENAMQREPRSNVISHKLSANGWYRILATTPQYASTSLGAHGSTALVNLHGWYNHNHNASCTFLVNMAYGGATTLKLLNTSSEKRYFTAIRYTIEEDVGYIEVQREVGYSEDLDLVQAELIYDDGLLPLIFSPATDTSVIQCQIPIDPNAVDYLVRRVYHGNRDEIVKLCSLKYDTSLSYVSFKITRSECYDGGGELQCYINGKYGMMTDANYLILTDKRKNISCYQNGEYLDVYIVANTYEDMWDVRISEQSYCDLICTKVAELPSAENLVYDLDTKKGLHGFREMNKERVLTYRDLFTHKLEVEGSSFFTEADLNYLLDHYSDKLEENSVYCFILNCNIVHSILTGGMKVINGFKASDAYQYQTADSYFFNKPLRRLKQNGVWGAWYEY